MDVLILRPPTPLQKKLMIMAPPPPPAPCENNEIDMETDPSSCTRRTIPPLQSNEMETENGSIILHQKDNPPSETDKILESKWKMDPLLSTIDNGAPPTTRPKKILIMVHPAHPPPFPPPPLKKHEMDMQNGSTILHQKDNPPSENNEMEMENGSIYLLCHRNNPPSDNKEMEVDLGSIIFSYRNTK